MENLEKRKLFELGLKSMQMKKGLNYSILDYIEYSGIEDRPIIFKHGLDRLIRNEVIAMGY